MMNPRSG